MTTKCAAWSALLLAGILSNNAWAMLGEPAPKLTVESWAKGGPLEVGPGTNIFVVEIWQTSLRSSRSSAQFFSDIQKRFETNGVIVVGICDEPAERLNAFVAAEGTNLAYAVAADSKHQTSAAYMNPIAQHGVPYAFIVGTNGTVLWHGWSPLELQQSLAQIVAGDFDLKRAKELEVATRQMRQYVELLKKADPRANISGRTLLANRTNNLPLLCDLAMEIMTLPPGLNRDLGLADAALTQAEQIQTTNSARVAYVRSQWLFQTGHPNEAIEHAAAAEKAATTAQDKDIIEAGLRQMRERAAAMEARKKPAKTPAPDSPVKPEDGGH